MHDPRALRSRNARKESSAREATTFTLRDGDAHPNLGRFARLAGDKIPDEETAASTPSFVIDTTPDGHHPAAELASRSADYAAIKAWLAKKEAYEFEHGVVAPMTRSELKAVSILAHNEVLSPSQIDPLDSKFQAQESATPPSSHPFSSPVAFMYGSLFVFGSWGVG